MKESIRRISTAVLVVGLLMFSAVIIQKATFLCSSGAPSCLVAAVSFSVVESPEIPMILSTENSMTTPDMAIDEPSVGSMVVSLVQVLSMYLILLSVVVLVVLEAFELRYLRKLMRSKHA